MTKISIALFLLLSPIICAGQYAYGFLSEMYFGRQPSARAEALGKAYSLTDGDLATIFYNPAGTATLQGAAVNTSFASPFYAFRHAKYDFISAGFNFNEYITLGLSRNHFTAGQVVDATDPSGNITSMGHTPTNSIYTLNISVRVAEDIFIGLNTNYLVWQPVEKAAHSVYFDFGAIKKFVLPKGAVTGHSINLGASISNFNFAEVNLDWQGREIEEKLPVTTRFGLSYQLEVNKKWISDSLTTFRFLLQGEYQYLLNSDYLSGLHTGLEITFLETISLRLGYYKEGVYNYNIPEVNKDEINAVTYGFGIQLPLSKVSKIPLNVSFDYTSLPQPGYTKTQPYYMNVQSDWENFNTFTMRVNYLFGK